MFVRTFTALIVMAGSALAQDAPVGLGGGSALTDSERAAAAAVIAAAPAAATTTARAHRSARRIVREEAPAKRVITDIRTLFGAPEKAAATASADDKFALVQEFDYGSGQTTNYIVNVTKNKRIDAKKTNLLPAIADEERVQASSLVMQNDDVRRKLGADVNNVELFVTPVDPASFNTVRVARVAFSVKGRALPFVKYVDLKNGKLIKTR